MVMQLLISLSAAEHDKEDTKDRENKSNSTYLTKKKNVMHTSSFSSSTFLEDVISLPVITSSRITPN